MSASLFSLHGQKAMVTGCTRGIGQAVAIGLAEAGADIILVQVCTVNASLPLFLYLCLYLYLDLTLPLQQTCRSLTGLRHHPPPPAERHERDKDQGGH